MARVNGFEQVGTRSQPHPTDVTIRYQVVKTSGDHLLQITTFGSKFRETKPKPSQTLQFDRESARRMVEILRETFGDL